MQKPQEPKIAVYVVFIPAVKGSGKREDQIAGIFRHKNMDGAHSMASQYDGGYVLRMKLPKSKCPFRV